TREVPRRLYILVGFGCENLIERFSLWGNCVWMLSFFGGRMGENGLLEPGFGLNLDAAAFRYPPYVGCPPANWGVLNPQFPSATIPATKIEAATPDQAWRLYLQLDGNKTLEKLAPRKLEQLIERVRLSNVSCRATRIMQIMKHIKERGRALRPMEYKALFYAFASTGRFDECLLLFQEVARAGVALSCSTYSMVIQFLGKRNKTLSATKLLNELVARQQTFADDTCCALMKAFLINNDADNALEVFRRMQQQGMEIPIATLSTLMRSLLRLRKSRYARLIFEVWSATNKDKVVTDRIYAPLIQVLVKDKLYQEAFAVFEYLQAKNVVLNEDARIAVAEALFNMGKLEDTAALVQASPEPPNNLQAIMMSTLKLLKAGQNPEPKLLETLHISYPGLPEFLVYRFIKEGRMREAEEILSRFVRLGFNARLRTYHMLMGGYFHAQQDAEALRVLWRLREAGLSPDKTIYDMAFKVITRTGNLTLAKRLYAEMREAGVVPQVTTFKYLMHALIQGGENSLAQDVFLDVLDLDIYPTCDLIIIATREFIELDNLDGAVRFMLHLIAAGVVPTMRNFDYVIDAMVRNGRLEEAERMLQVVRQCGLVPSIQTCTLIIQGHVRSKDLEHAQKLLNEMHEWGVEPDTVAYAVVTRGLILSKQFSRTRDLFAAMQSRGLTPTLLNYSCLIGPHTIRVGIEDAENFVSQLNEKGIQPDGYLFCLLMNAMLAKLGPAEVIRYAQKHAATLFAFPEPLGYMVRSACKHPEMLPPVSEIWSELEASRFGFQPEHYHDYLCALLQASNFERAVYIIEYALHNGIQLRPRTLSLLQSHLDLRYELLSDEVRVAFEKILLHFSPLN
ncbi:hypothetical protein L0F63_006801, partial [Massospora cicadina]